MTTDETRAVKAVAGLVALLALIGFANSFAAVQRALGPSFGWLAWTGPIGIDVAIAAFSAMDIVLARLNMRMRLLRLFPWTLAAATVYLNVARETDWVGWIAHTVFPVLWIVAVEVGAHATRVRAGLADTKRMERIRRARWLLAPAPTALMYRRMVLWEVRSYDEALARERSRLLAKADMREAHGRRWRWKAPYRDRVLYRLGELAPPPVAISAPVPRHGAKNAPTDAPPKTISAPRLTEDLGETSYGPPEATGGALIHGNGANGGADFRADQDDQRAGARHAETISAPGFAPTSDAGQPREIDMPVDLLARRGANDDANDDDGDAPSPPYPTKKAHLEALLEELDPRDTRTTYELARDLAPMIKLHDGTARTYVAAWREKRATQDDQRAAARTDGAFPAAQNGQAPVPTQPGQRDVS